MNADLFNKLSEFSQSAAARLVVKSALNPLLWMCVVISPTCFYTGYLLRDDRVLKYLLVIAGLAPVALTCSVAGYFAFGKPEKLQSEEYQLRHQTLNIIKEKGGRIRVDNVSLEEISNPRPPALPDEGSTD